MARWSAVGGWQDCNLNAVLDGCDIESDPAADANGDGFLDTCVCTSAADCASADPCLVGVCDNDVCAFGPADCDDGDACTDDTCTPGIGCANVDNGCRGACMYPEGSCRPVTAQACAAYVCNVSELLGTHAAACYGDTYGDGMVNAADRNEISWYFRRAWFDTLCTYDLDGNGLINPADRGVVAANIGQCNPLPDWQNGSGLNHGQADTRFSPGTFLGVGESCGETYCP